MLPSNILASRQVPSSGVVLHKGASTRDSSQTIEIKTRRLIHLRNPLPGGSIGRGSGLRVLSRMVVRFCLWWYCIVCHIGLWVIFKFGSLKVFLISPKIATRNLVNLC